MLYQNITKERKLNKYSVLVWLTPPTQQQQKNDPYLSNIPNFVYMQRKGFYIRKSDKDGNLLLNIHRDDFTAFMASLNDNNGWLKFRIFEREQVDKNGFTHNMEAIVSYKSSETEN